jgi:hypothetical protein
VCKHAWFWGEFCRFCILHFALVLMPWTCLLCFDAWFCDGLYITIKLYIFLTKDYNVTWHVFLYVLPLHRCHLSNIVAVQRTNTKGCRFIEPQTALYRPVSS